MTIESFSLLSFILHPSSFVVFFSLLLAASVWPGEPPAPLCYGCKKGDLFRFEYSKKITVKQPDEKGAVGERITEAKAVLVLEILKDPGPAGTAAMMRFDSPRITLPVIKLFSAQYDEPEDQAEKSRAVARALEGAMKQARWGVTWSADGALRIDTRTPEKLQDWLKEPANAGTWRKKASEAMVSFVEQDLGVRIKTVDRELLLCFTSLSSGMPPGLSLLRPVRSAPAVLSRSGSKAELSFKRLAPANPGTPYLIPGLSAAHEVRACLQNVTTKKGRATFDTKLLMLDALDEEYQAEVLYTSGSGTLRQELMVEYHLKRLAPAIAQPE